MGQEAAVTAPTPPAAPHWWRERELWLVLAFVAVAFAVRINTLPMHGEESRRAMVAVEMMWYGDWLVPRQQGELYVSRPPLQNWLIGACLWAFGSKEPWVPRVPSVVAIVLTAGLVYGYSRQFLGRAGATAAALAYPTAGAILVNGVDAETEPVFSLILSAAILVWHWGYARGWGPTPTWGAAYTLAGLAMLTKGGAQPPVYLLGGTGMYLLWRRDWRFAFHPGHLLGILGGVAVVCAWTVPYWLRSGDVATMMIFANQTAARFVGWRFGEFAQHLALFPPEAFGGTLPWGLLLAAYLLPATRRELASSPCVAFCVGVLLVAFPTCWVAPTGQIRYLYPVFPCAAVLAGVFVDRLSTAQPEAVFRYWRGFLDFWSVFIALAAVGVLASAVVPLPSQFAHLRFPLPQAPVYAAVLAVLARLLWAGRSDASECRVMTSVAALALSAAVVVTGLMMDVRARRANDIGEEMAPVKAAIGDARLVSVGPVPHSFRYHWDRQIPLHIADPEVIRPGHYFCFSDSPELRRLIPFAWEQVALVSLDRVKYPEPKVAVVVARRVR